MLGLILLIMALPFVASLSFAVNVMVIKRRYFAFQLAKSILRLDGRTVQYPIIRLLTIDYSEPLESPVLLRVSNTMTCTTTKTSSAEEFFDVSLYFVRELVMCEYDLWRKVHSTLEFNIGIIPKQMRTE